MKKDDDCNDPNPCPQNSVCIDKSGNNKYTCECKDGYYGDSCEIVCGLTKTDAGYSCSCKNGYSANSFQNDRYNKSTNIEDINTENKSATSTVPTSATSVSTSTVPITAISVSTSTVPITATPVSTSTVPITATSVSTSTVPITPTSVSTTTVPITPTSVSKSTLPITEITTLLSTSSKPITTSTSVKSDKSSSPSPTDTAERNQGGQTTVVVSVTIPVVVVVICAVILGVCLIRRWKRKKGLGTTALERAPGIAISNTSYGDHQVNIPKAESVHVPDGTSNEYAEIVANGNPVNEQADGYYTFNDVPTISQINNTNYAHVNTHNAFMLNSNYSHIKNNNKKVSKTGDYGFSMFKRGIFQLKKSFKKETDSSYDNLEMKTVVNSPNKTVKDVAMTEMESEYNHTQSGVHGTIKKDIQNEKDEYSHLDFKPKSMREHANEVANENPYSRGQSKLTSELSTNVRANEYENAVGNRHVYFVFEAVGESGDDSIEKSDITKFEERNSNSASGFQYEYAREVERSGTHKNEETRDFQRACPYELAKDIDKNSDIANKADGDSFGTSSATDDENQNHHYFILSKI